MCDSYCLLFLKLPFPGVQSIKYYLIWTRISTTQSVIVIDVTRNDVRNIPEHKIKILVSKSKSKNMFTDFVSDKSQKRTFGGTLVYVAECK